MIRTTPASLASAFIAAAIVLTSWTSTLATPSARAAAAPAPVAAHVILA